jgi:hypothetical protein
VVEAELRHQQASTFFRINFDLGILKLQLLEEGKMYKWHVNSAISRGRPLANDFLKAADGIAASLKQFSISVSRAAEDEGTSIGRALDVSIYYLLCNYL